jgi:ribonucleoside-diphosphate reductase alpha chain
MAMERPEALGSDRGRSVATGGGVDIQRRFVKPGIDPYDEVEWETRSAVIQAEGGETVFEQREVEVPKPWSQLATNVVVSKYFRGPLGTPQRERSVRQLIGRVVKTIGGWGTDQGYFTTPGNRQNFEDELTHMLLQQKFSFNSPVWFNVGVEPEPQCSACFILSVDDTMDSILDWYRKEGVIFKGGSGSGVNLSRLRSSREKLGGGGTASGPVSFMRAADASAGVIKSFLYATIRPSRMGMREASQLGLVVICWVKVRMPLVSADWSDSSQTLPPQIILSIMRMPPERSLASMTGKEAG